VKSVAEKGVRQQETPRINASDLAVIKKRNMFSSVGRQVSKLGSINQMSLKGKLISFTVLAGIIMIPLGTFLIIRASGQPDFVTTAIIEARGDFETAKLNIEDGEIKEARSLLSNALSTIRDLEEYDDIVPLKQEIENTLADINKVSADSPVEYYVFSDDATVILSNITMFGEIPLVMTGDGKLISIGEEADVLHSFEDIMPARLFATSKRAAALNTDYTFAVYNMETQNTGLFEPEQLDDPVSDVTLYEGNMYVLAANQIYKYANATTGDVEYSEWINGELDDNLISLAIDGNIYVLTDKGDVITMFKGEEESRFDLGVIPSEDARLITVDNSEYIYLFEPETELLSVFNKENGRLKKTYDVNVGGTLQDLTIDADDVIWLASENAVWKLIP